MIGCGNYGMTDVRAAFKAGGVEIVALCDVDSQHLAEAATAIEKMQGSRPKTFKHYEELLATPGLQAVIIATPPHWHALPFLAAVEKNLDIYCEKPLAYDIREAQAMVAAAKKKDIVIQIGFQRRQSPALRQVRDYLQQGNLGRIVQVDAQIHYLGRPAGRHAAGPAGLAGLGPLVRPGAQDPLLAPGRPLRLASGKDDRARAPRGLGHSPDRRDALDSRD